MNVDRQYYLDTSALLPYYREEAGSRKVQKTLQSHKPPVIISDLTRVEFASALARLLRMKELSEAQANAIESTFLQDINDGLYLRKPLVVSHYNQAERWLSARKTAMRTLDALHLACCRGHDAELITCDAVLHKAAGHFGVSSQFVKS